MDSDWAEGIFLGQRSVSGEYLVGSPQGVFRPRTVRRVPLEQRWVDNLSMISCLPWKHNSRHEAGDEVLLSEEPPTPSMTPEVTQLPPRSPDDPKLRDVRQFYVKPYDLDPADSGIGFTDGCPGCRSIVYNTKPRHAHSNKCRHRVIATAATNKDVAARVNKAINRDVEYHAKKLEADEAKKRRPAEEEASDERKAKEPRGAVGPPEVQAPPQENETYTPSSSSQGPSTSKVKTKFESKKRDTKVRSEDSTGRAAPAGVPNIKRRRA